MDFDRLRHFVATVHAGTVSAAAKEVHITQSALSRSLQQLEYDLGAKLFAKSGRRLVLAPAGKALLPEAVRLLHECDRVTRAVRQVDERGYEHLRLGVIDSVAGWLVPGVLPTLSRKFPDLRLTLRTGRSPDLLAEVDRDALDLVVVAWSGTPSARAKELARYDLKYYGRKDRFASLRKCRVERDLEQFPIVGLTPATPTPGASPGKADASSWVSNVATVKALIMGGLGVGHLPNFVLTPTEKKPLVSAPIEHDPMCALFVVGSPTWTTGSQKEIERVLAQGLTRQMRGAAKR